ncbi:TRAP transporter large permease subunit [Arenibaculum sp.]|jgi:tripartite ATP-independent transporter DctM subunit|uniref:TRAP transporter large permease n=1 Tax=Arenibaculum sp. TaxID=2865862 RepID=UPI002E156850|nr:TRAP transporter large permease subunit [Arenibaculum sp.]
MLFDIPIPLLMFATLFAFIFLGVPVAFALIGTSFLFGLSIFGQVTGLQLWNQLFDVASRYVLAAVPMFIFMGAVLERSRLAERLFHSMRMLVGNLPGGLALATIAMCALFAAGTGIVGAVEVLVGLIAIPAMMRYGYSRSLIAGTICAGGSLGTMIPPSIVVVIYAAMAQISIGELFAAVLIPGSMMVVLFVVYIVGHAMLFPADAPRLPADDVSLPLSARLRVFAEGVIPPLILIVAVIGSILAGIASPTEAAAVGSIGVVLLTIWYRDFSPKMLFDALMKTITINTMVVFIVIGGTMFAGVFLVHGGSRMVDDLISAWDLGPTGVMLMFLAVLFLLGFVLDWVSVVLIAVPLFVPIIKVHGIDPIWLGAMAVVMIQTSYLTPPMAPSIFYLRSIAPPEMTFGEMYRGVAPFVVCQLLTLALIAVAPWTATWLPSLMR